MLSFEAVGSPAPPDLMMSGVLLFLMTVGDAYIVYKFVLPACRTGVFSWKGQSIRREDHPLTFRAFLAFGMFAPLVPALFFLFFYLSQ